jgi:hypothetical protein
MLVTTPTPLGWLSNLFTNRQVYPSATTGRYRAASRSVVPCICRTISLERDAGSIW